MPRRQKIPQSINSQYFTGVTPLWVAPGSESIPDKYHDAVRLLAEWAGPSWSDNEQTDFFLIRTVVVQSCKSWAAYDWDADDQWISELRSDNRRYAKLVKAAENIAILLGQPGFRFVKHQFLRSFLLDIGVDIPESLTNGEAVAAVERSFQRLAEGAKIQSWPRVRYGAVEYESLPGRLPQKEVAVALSIADRITFFRKDGHSAGSLCTPHPPHISPSLPWRAIAYFASANASTDRQVDESSIQKQVTSLARSVGSVYWSAR